MISAGDAKDARGRRVPLMNTCTLVALASPRVQGTGQVRAVKQVELQLLLLGAENTFHYQPSFFYLLYLLSCNVGHSTSFPSCCWPTADYRASVLMRSPFTAWPGLACRRPTAIHTYCAYILSTHCSDCMQCAARLLAAGCPLTHGVHESRYGHRGQRELSTPASQPPHPPTHPSVRPSVTQLASLP